MLPHGIWDRSCIANWNDGHLPKDGFHWENVKHLTVLLALIVDPIRYELILHEEVEWLEQTVRYYVDVMTREQRSELGITPERARHIIKKGKVRRALPAACC